MGALGAPGKGLGNGFGWIYKRSLWLDQGKIVYFASALLVGILRFRTQTSYDWLSVCQNPSEVCFFFLLTP